MKKLLWCNPLRYWLFTLLGLLVFMSCDKDDTNVDSVTKELLATASSETTVADGGTIKFIDLSLGVKNRQWTFPGGIPVNSDEPEIDVVFSEAGDVIATLEVEYVDGTKESMEFFITVFPVLIADFTPSATRILVGETVTFTDNSIGEPTSWSWEFEGGTPATSTDQNPTVQFDINNPTTIKLTVTRALDGSSSEVEKVIQVGPPELTLNGSFEDGLITDYQTWNGSGFPLEIGTPGANGTNYCASFDYNNWGGAELMSRDKPVERMIAVENGQSYTVSMYIKADTAGVLKIGWFQLGNVNPGEGYKSSWGTNGQILNTEWQKVEFVTTIPTDNGDWLNAYHSFWFTKVDGGATVNTKVYVDELSIKIVE